MKTWPTAPQAAKPKTSFNARGCRERKAMAEESSVPVDGGIGSGKRARMGLSDER